MVTGKKPKRKISDEKIIIHEKPTDDIAVNIDQVIAERKDIFKAPNLSTKMPPKNISATYPHANADKSIPCCNSLREYSSAMGITACEILTRTK